MVFDGLGLLKVLGAHLANRLTKRSGQPLLDLVAVAELEVRRQRAAPLRRLPACC
jgi:hypothetical protein